jgi:hypothetical protein
MHVRARLDQRHRRLRVAIQRRQVQRRPPAQPKQPLLQLHTRVDGPSTPAPWQPTNTRMQPRETAPGVSLAVHVRARLDQRHRRLRVAVLRRHVQRRPPAKPKQPLLQLRPRIDGPSTPHCGNPTTPACNPRAEQYPSTSLQCTSAPASTSAIAVSMWPSCAVNCSAVHLHSRSSHSCSSAPESTDRPPPHCGEPTTPGCSPRVEPYPSPSLQCTSAPAFTSAIAVSVWPLDDAKCSAVHLHSKHMPVPRRQFAKPRHSPHCRQSLKKHSPTLCRLDSRRDRKEYPPGSVEWTSEPAASSAFTPPASP